MRLPEDAARCPFHLLEHRHGLAAIVERAAAAVPPERPCVNPLRPNRRRARAHRCDRATLLEVQAAHARHRRDVL